MSGRSASADRTRDRGAGNRASEGSALRRRPTRVAPPHGGRAQVVGHGPLGGRVEAAADPQSQVVSGLVDDQGFQSFNTYRPSLGVCLEFPDHDRATECLYEPYQPLFEWWEVVSGRRVRFANAIEGPFWTGGRLRLRDSDGGEYSVAGELTAISADGSLEVPRGRGQLVLELFPHGHARIQMPDGTAPTLRLRAWNLASDQRRVDVQLETRPLGPGVPMTDKDAG
jgi:hypothetical protein